KEIFCKSIFQYLVRMEIEKFILLNFSFIRGAKYNETGQQKKLIFYTGVMASAGGFRPEKSPLRRVLSSPVTGTISSELFGTHHATVQSASRRL
ncbi:MAG: hypothetical protein ACXVCF_13305, partial [Isosphaeraceae bacterium]